MRGIAPPRQRPPGANLTLAAENLADHLTHFYLFFMPDFARAEYESRRWYHGVAERFRATVGSAPNEVLPARARFMQAMGPARRQMAAYAGGAARRLDAAAAKLGDLSPAPHPARVSRLPRTHHLRRAAGGVRRARQPCGAGSAGQREQGDLRSFLAIADDLDLWRLGRGTERFMSYGCYAQDERRLFPAGVWHGRLQALDPGAIDRGHGHSWYAATGRPQHPAEGGTLPVAERTAPIPGASRRAWAARWWRPARWRGRWWPAIRWCAT
jgi:Ni,Fe-hydrogenase I large subunit